MDMKKLTTAVVSGAMFFGAFVPSAFAANVTVSGNGSYSSTNVGIRSDQSTTVRQSNTNTVTNDIASHVSTGNNQSNNNTGGSTTTHTGDGTSIVDVTNHGSTNTATVPNCGCTDTTNVTVSGNGTHSTSMVDVWKWDKKSYDQKNMSQFQNMIDSHVSTGDNAANDNTNSWWMNHSSNTTTGNGMSGVVVHNWGSSNMMN